MRETLGQNIIIENKPGGSGIIAIRDLVRSKPDGYTIMIGNVSTNGLTPILFRDRMEMDYEKEVTAIARLANVPALIIANIDFPPNSFKEWIEYARKNPEKVRYGSAGIGAYQQINTEHLSKQEGLKMIHIPIKGGGTEIMQNLVSGDVQVTFFNMANSHRLVKDGKIKAFAITTDERHPVAPDIPTLAELGYAHIGVTQWQVAFAPAGVPEEILQKLNDAFNKALKSPKALEVYKNTGMIAPPPNDAKQAAEWVRSEQARLKKIVDETGIVVK
jgi:tripartite-type tricarboxylate transporter receptor subunit TctC